MNYFKKYFLFIIILISGILALLRFNSLQIGTTYDDAHYVILAESLSSGQGYQLINFPQPQNERAFPPGWPALLAPLTYISPGDYTALKLLTLILWIATLPLIYHYFSKQVESPYLEMLIGLIAINPLLVGISVTTMSESAYLFFSLIALTLFDSWHSKTEGTNYWHIILIAIVALYALLIRTIGISIFFALLIYFLYMRRYREAGITLGIFALGTLFQAWLNLRNGGSVVSVGYEVQVFNNSIFGKLGQMWSNVLGYSNEVLASSLVPVFGEKITSLVGSAIPSLTNIIIILLVIIGVMPSLKKISLPDIYFIIYLLAVLAYWNPRVGSVKARYLIPIIPFLYLYFIQGIKWSVNKLTKNNSIYTMRVVAVLTGIIVLISLVRNLQDWRNPVMNQITDLSIGSSWVAQNASTDAIVMVNEPVPAYIHVQRKTVDYPKEGQDFDKYLDNQGIDYIIIAPKLQSPRSLDLDLIVQNEVLPKLQSSPDKFTLVYENKEYNVFVYQYNSAD